MTNIQRTNRMTDNVADMMKSMNKMYELGKYATDTADALMIITTVLQDIALSLADIADSMNGVE